MINILEDITQYTEEHFVPSLLLEERKGIYNYSYNQFEEINDSLRIQNPNEQAKYIESALSKFHYDKPIRVFRKLLIHGHGLIRFIDECQKGYFIDRGFQSTSLTYNGYLRTFNVMIDLNIEDPTKGAYIGPISYYSHEKEYLLKPCTRIDIDYLTQNDKYVNIKGRVK